ncbi:MAG: tRNA (adenosine(37)-N6)-threonylcarbamoyltransferase complex transferase subunit TsaD [Pseudomonadota bacterium]
MTVLGIETSCDETAAAVVRRTIDETGSSRGEVLSNVVRSQWAEHAAFGGVVPEIAARAHLDCLDEITALALENSDCRLADVDRIAVTAGPGLIGGLLVGLTFAKGLAVQSGKPLDPINHLEGHALTVGLTDSVSPPYLLLLVSGGHTQLIGVTEVGAYHRLGTTVDDALGEAFDKTAKLLGLDAPGGPAVERAAASGDPRAIQLPRPMLGRPDANFSFAGLKTAVRNAAMEAATRRTDSSSIDRDLPALTTDHVADICASFQAAVADVVTDRVQVAMTLMANLADTRQLVIAGGVAANLTLRSRLYRLAGDVGWTLTAPPLALCSDNAAMIAWTSAARHAAGLTSDAAQAESLAFAARSRWPLDDSQPGLIGSGRRGAKA